MYAQICDDYRAGWTESIEMKMQRNVEMISRKLRNVEGIISGPTFVRRSIYGKRTFFFNGLKLLLWWEKF